jgi:hypothetical protein
MCCHFGVVLDGDLLVLPTWAAGTASDRSLVKTRGGANDEEQDLVPYWTGVIPLRVAREPKSVVVALDGAGRRAAKAHEQWAAVLDIGFALLSVESSQLMSPMYRTWPDPEHARQDIDRAIGRLPDELRELPLIAAGFSAGGPAALDWALDQPSCPGGGRRRTGLLRSASRRQKRRNRCRRRRS